MVLSTEYYTVKQQLIYFLLKTKRGKKGKTFLNLYYKYSITVLLEWLATCSKTAMHFGMLAVKALGIVSAGNASSGLKEFGRGN